ncbi:MAG TPA: ABC transporter ATP-binding protein [Patescibacteria group bacterium]|nr:ABC transporter ATP-binding protein [Patescibacteria group bacterium]
MIQIQNFNFWYPGRGEATLREVNLTVKPGEMLLLTGPTGCGKSTLLKCLNGIIPHLSGGRSMGLVLVAGMDTRSQTMAQLSARVGLVQQCPDDQIFSTIIQDEVVFGPENLCLPRQEIEKRLEWALAAVDLSGFQRRSTTALSGGQKQRLAIASMLALRPHILALDEPISQLDPQGAVEVLEIVKKLQQNYGVTVVMVEHRIHEVAQYVERVAVMDEGRLVFDAPVRQAMAQAELFAGMGLRLPETVEISRRFHQVGMTVGETVTLLKQERRKHGSSAISGARTHLPFFPKIRYPVDGLAAVEARDLYHRYGKKEEYTLNGVSLRVKRGERVAVMGRNGAGKSTLLSHLAGLKAPQQGDVRIAGISFGGKLPLGMVGMVMQNPDLMLFQTSVRREIEFGLHNLRLPPAVIKERYKRVVENFSLDRLQDDSPLALSRGQRLRVAIAAVVAMAPLIVFLDEPTTGQDKRNMDGMMAALREQVDTLVFGTHDVEIALAHATRLLVLDQGRLAADGAPRELLADRELMNRCGLRPTPSWLVGQELGLDNVFTPQELEARWIC